MNSNIIKWEEDVIVPKGELIPNGGTVKIKND